MADPHRFPRVEPIQQESNPNTAREPSDGPAAAGPELQPTPTAPMQVQSSGAPLMPLTTEPESIYASLFPEDFRKRILPKIVRGAKIAGIVLAGLLVVAAIAVVSIVRYHEAGLPSVEQLRTGYNPPQITRVLARDGTLLASLFTERRTVIPFDTIPSHTKLAFLAAEDASFYEHEGLDYFGMLRAMVANMRAGKTRQGGSTITQQVVKNVLLEPERTYKRKIRETILARKLEQQLTKDQIFHLYLNHIYLGHGRYGIEEAARYYYGKRATELDLAESALLAGVVAAPERFSPRNASERALERRRYVLEQMLKKGFVTAELQLKALGAPLRLAPAAEAESELVPEVIPIVTRTLRQIAGDAATRGGFGVQTSIDPALQAAARRAIREALEAYAKRQKVEPPFTHKKRRLWGAPFEGHPKAHHIYVGTVVSSNDADGTIDVQVGDVVGRVLLSKEDRYNAKRLPPSEFAEVGALLRVSLLSAPEPGPPVPLRLELGPQAALVALDVRTGQLLALVGSHEALVGGLDRATQSKRQPGSAFKPIVYSYAIHSRRLTPATVLELPPDPKAKKKGEPPPTEARRLTVRMALAKSDNLAAQKIFEEVGPANVVTWAHALGIEADLKPTPSLALGAYEVAPIELAVAYRTFASGGIYRPVSVITKVTAAGGQSLSLPAQPPERRVMQPDEAYLITSLMRSVIENGTGQGAKLLKRPLAGKTGTTNEAKDAWFAGYSTDIVAAVWVGYDDALPLGPGEAGSRTALPAWISFMKAAHEKRTATEFPRPASVIVTRIDATTGLLPYPGQEDAVDEEFLEGTVPTSVAESTAEPLEDAGAALQDPEVSSTPTPREVPDAGSAVEQPPF
jgi:penicillin-binding protein 1A